jgi:hypothetical protein
MSDVGYCRQNNQCRFPPLEKRGERGGGVERGKGIKGLIIYRATSLITQLSKPLGTDPGSERKVHTVQINVTILNNTTPVTLDCIYIYTSINTN